MREGGPCGLTLAGDGGEAGLLSPSEDAEFRPSARLLVPRIEGDMYNNLVSPDPGGQSAGGSEPECVRYCPMDRGHWGDVCPARWSTVFKGRPRQGMKLSPPYRVERPEDCMQTELDTTSRVARVPSEPLEVPSLSQVSRRGRSGFP